MASLASLAVEKIAKTLDITGFFDGFTASLFASLAEKSEDKQKEVAQGSSDQGNDKSFNVGETIEFKL